MLLSFKSSLLLFLADIVCLSLAAGTSTSTGASASMASASSTPSARVTLVIEPSFDTNRTTFVLLTSTSTLGGVAQSTARPSKPSSDLNCQIDTYANATGPFCLPNNGSQQIQNKQYSVTWDPSFASDCQSVTIALVYHGTTTGQLVTSTKLDNSIGFWNYTVDSGWLNMQSTQTAQLLIVPYECSGTSQPSQQTGPIIEMRSKLQVTVVKPTSRDRVLGLSIGLPLAFLAVLGVVGLVFWWNSGHRTIPVFGRERGYDGRKARAVKLQDMDSDGRYGRYRDEP
ncbi:hypothetical protein PYCC9005_001919 [Savitreella phatthalungensis]